MTTNQDSKINRLIDINLVFLAGLELYEGDKEQLVREAAERLSKKYTMEEIRQKVTRMTFDLVSGDGKK